MVEVVVLRAIALGTAVAVAQAVLSAGLLSRYEDNDSELTEAQRALEKVAELDRRLTDLVVPARRVAAQVQQTTARRTIAVHAAVPELIGEWDAVRLERVLGNLLGNAVKYNPEGSDVSVEIRQEQQDGHAWACVGIRDRGIGIPAADLPRIFERYHRAANVVGRFPGEGIGLAGARQVIEQHGGMIGVHSHEGQGSTFTVRLRIHRDRLPAE